ncbi:MAG: FkbM family methyltransferase [Gemmataceae bacterium]
MITRIARCLVPGWLWTKLRLARQRLTLARYGSRVVSHTYAGFPLRVHLADPLAEGWYDRDWPPMPEVELLKRYRLKSGALVFDLGAHQGVVALILARTVGPTGAVVAVEANPHNAEQGRRNRDLNHAPQLTIMHAAVADRPGTMTFNQGLNGQMDDGSGAWGTAEVPAVTIDQLADRHGRPDVLFIDVEGYECHALRGAARTLEGRPDCFVEVHVGEGLERFGGTAADVLGFFPEEHYERFVASPDGSAFVPAGDGAGVMAGRFFLVAVRRG